MSKEEKKIVIAIEKALEDKGFAEKILRALYGARRIRSGK